MKATSTHTVLDWRIHPCLCMIGTLEYSFTARVMHLNILVQCSPSPQFKGLWRHPQDKTAMGYRSLDYWTALGRQLEEATIDALFFADVHGIYDVYHGSWETSLRHAVQVPAIDPVLVIPAMAAVTEQLGFAVTYSTTYHPPYQCARLFSSLDHLTKGRIAWNIVTSYLSSALANGLGDHLSHDERYDRADEYVTVVRELWERSWDDDAVVRDATDNRFTDARRVHAINHHGRWFNVRGPHQCEPSPQRTPVLYQAGSSGRGITFAARHAEVVFVTLPDMASGARHVANLREQAARLGRPPETVRVLQAQFVMLGRDAAEVRAKADLLEQLASPEGEIAKWCGWMGFDLAAWGADVPIDAIDTDASRSVREFLKRFDASRAWTVGDVRAMVLLPRRPHRRMGWLFGTPQQVADSMEEWLERTKVGGFNLMPCPPSGGIDDICNLLVPELKRRGLMPSTYDRSRPTLRERYFGAGRRRYGWWASGAES